ncbi:hypothetical protein D3C78_1792980 [compost metagenome]
MARVISINPATDNNAPINAIPRSIGRNRSSVPALYSANNASPNNSSKSTYNANRSTMLISSAIAHFTLNVTLPVIGCVSEDTARHWTW